MGKSRANSHCYITSFVRKTTTFSLVSIQWNNSLVIPQVEKEISKKTSKQLHRFSFILECEHASGVLAVMFNAFWASARYEVERQKNVIKILQLFLITQVIHTSFTSVNYVRLF